jgi:hypothetical protein
MNFRIPFLSKTKEDNPKNEVRINSKVLEEKESTLDALLAERSEYIRQLYCYYDTVKEKH